MLLSGLEGNVLQGFESVSAIKSLVSTTRLKPSRKKTFVRKREKIPCKKRQESIEEKKVAINQRKRKLKKRIRSKEIHNELKKKREKKERD